MQIIKSGIVVGFFTLVSRIFGYIRDIFMASYLGLNADSFAVAFRLPNTFRSLFAEGAFSAAFVPMFSSKLTKEGQDNAIKFASQVFSLLTLILASFVSLMLFFMPQIVSVLAPGFMDSPDKFLLTISLSYFTVPYLFFIALASLYVGVLNSCGKFAIASSLPIVLNLVMIMAIKFLTPISQTPSHALSYGVFLAGIAQLGIIIFAAHKASLQIKFTKITIDQDMKHMFKNMLPAIIGSGVVQINIAISTIIASYIDEAPSILYFAERLNQFPLAIIGTALGTVLLPTLSQQIRNNEFDQAVKTQNKALEIALFLSLPCAFALSVIGGTLVSFLFERGEFTAEDSVRVANTLAALAFGLPAFVMVKIFTPRYFAEYDTKTPVRISIACIIMNILFSLLLIQFFSYVGIAIATTMAAWINVGLLYYYQYKRNIFRIKKDFLIKAFKILFACCLMSFGLLAFEKLLPTHDNNFLKFLLFASEILVGMLIYFGICYYSKVMDLSFIYKKGVK
ncbi:MAG: murein biosynthesis integral membrane protein MurJ [Pseudomonadota bacterium]